MQTTMKTYVTTNNAKDALLRPEVVYTPFCGVDESIPPTIPRIRATTRIVSIDLMTLVLTIM